MSGNLGSTKGENTSKATSKSGYDRLDINKLYKGKTAEPVAKTVTQKHGMQTLGKAPPARRAGASVVKPEVPSSNDTGNSQPAPNSQQLPPPVNLGQPIQQPPKWTNSTGPSVPPSANVPNVPPPQGPPNHEKNWNGPDIAANYQSQRFAQEFPSLDAGSDSTKNSMPNSMQPPASGQHSSKSLDNQYGPGPILRPQTEGSWTPGVGRGGPRPLGPGPPPNREPGSERPNLGGPTPPPMSLGQGGPPPPPLGVYPMQFRGMAPFMYPNGPPPPGPGYYPPHGMRYGMPAPPPPRESSDSHREHNRNRGPPPSMRPTQQFAVKPIIREEDMKRMDDIDQEGTWASVRDEVDYNKKINFSDEEDERDVARKPLEKAEDEGRSTRDAREKRQVRILERQQSEREHRHDNIEKDSGGKSEMEKEEDWNKSRSATQFDTKDRDRVNARRGREDDWRGNRFEDDLRNKKVAPNRVEPRGGQDFAAKQYSNLPPRLLRQQQQQNYSVNTRRSPSPTSGGDRDREHQHRERDREVEKRAPPTQYRILERNRGDSESSNSSVRDKRGSNDYSLSKLEKDKEGKRKTVDTDKDHESLKQKMEGLDIRKDESREEKNSKRGHRFSTSSWADQVDDEDGSSKDYDDYPKGAPVPSIKSEIKEERVVPKRVYIQQRQVENMTTQQKLIAASEPPKPVGHDHQKQDKQQQDAGKQVPWGERDEKEKLRMNEEKISEETQENKNESGLPGERKIILSEKAKLLPHNRQDNREKRDIHTDERDIREKTPPHVDNKYRNNVDKGGDKYGGPHEPNSRQERDRTWGNNRDRPKQNKWGSGPMEGKGDNKTPEKETTSSGRSSATDGSNISSVEKSRSGDFAKDGSPSSDKDKSTKGREDSFTKDKDQEKAAFDRRKGYQEEDDGRGSKSNRGRERMGHGVYQPRGWGRPDGRGKHRGGGGRDFYDRPRRNDFDRERDERAHPKEEEERRGEEKEKHLEKMEKEAALLKEESTNDMTDEDKLIKEGGIEANKKATRSPATNKRSPRGGGRLHGYGPPSDKPFSSGSSTKEEDIMKEKSSDNANKSSPASSGPVPLMELGDISPPNMMSGPGRGRHHVNRGRGGTVGTVQPKAERHEGYSFRGVNKRARGGGDAKPLMSLNSDYDKNEEGETDSQDEESKKNKTRDSSKGHEKYRQTDISKQPGKSISEYNDGFNKSKGKGMSEIDNAHDSTGPGSMSDNSENIDEGQGKHSKEKLNGSKFVRTEKQQQRALPVGNGKDQRGKQQPFETHPRPGGGMAPRFQKGGNFPNSKGGDTVHETSSESNIWEKPTTTAKDEPHVPTSLQPEAKVPSATVPELKANVSPVFNAQAVLDNPCGPVKTMIFENRNYKAAPKAPGDKGGDGKGAGVISTGLELTKDIGLCFGKETGSESQEIDFSSNFENNSSGQTSQTMSYQSATKPMPIGQSRVFQSHQPSPVSPLAKDLTDKIESTRLVWERTMPSVAEQNDVNALDESANFHSGFTVSDFKSDTSRDFSASLSQTHSNYTTAASPALAAISKPESSTSPNAAAARQVKPPQQQQQQQVSMENHVTMSSSPFTFSMPQQHQTAAFGGPTAIPSPPTAMVYGSSQPLSAHAHSGGVYQAFPHVDSSQVLNSNTRSQYGQYSAPQGNATPYGLSSSIFMDAGYQPYQPSHHQQSNQGPTPSNRSPGPGPMPTSGVTTSGGISTMKSQTAQGHSIPQVIGTPAQQSYSQMTPHHPGSMPHHQMSQVGHVSKSQSGYTQSGMGMTSQSQVYIPYDPSQTLLNFGQSFVSSSMRNAPGGPPPSATPPVQGIQPSSAYYSANAGGQVYPGTSQGNAMQPLVVGPNPQSLQNLQAAAQQFGQQQYHLPAYNQLQGYAQQPASNVSAIGLGGQMMRQGHATHSHYGVNKGMDMGQPNHGMKSHDPMINPTWNTHGFPLHQGFPGSGKGGNTSDRNAGNMGNQRKGSHPMSGMPNVGGVPHNRTNAGFPSQKGGRFVGPIQRPVPNFANGAPGSITVSGGLRMLGEHKHRDSLNQTSSAHEEGLLDKLITEGHRSSTTTTTAISSAPSKMIISNSRRVMEENNVGQNGNDALQIPTVIIPVSSKSPIISNTENAN